MNTTAKLLLHCPDQPGILAEVTNFITINKGNIVYLDQYVDHVENIFFMRIEWEIKDFFIPKNKIEDYFETLYAQKYEMKFRLYFSDVKPKMAIFVSKLSQSRLPCRCRAIRARRRGWRQARIWPWGRSRTRSP